ncbi:MAG: hypothetical protein Q7V06_00040, partial [Methanocalculus sp.]|nr:hypothetical protein [Methanocalculus sp.]
GSQVRIREELVATIRESQIPTILVTHSQDDARLMGDRILRLDQGSVVGEELPEDLGIPLSLARGRPLSSPKRQTC